jgi:hypothetical protein
LHRTQLKKKKNTFKDFSVFFFFLFLLFSRLDMWDGAWVQSETVPDYPMISMHDGGLALRLTLAQEPRRKRLHKDGGQKTRSKESNSLGDFSDPHGA